MLGITISRILLISLELTFFSKGEAISVLVLNNSSLDDDESFRIFIIDGHTWLERTSVDEICLPIKLMRWSLGVSRLQRMDIMED